MDNNADAILSKIIQSIENDDLNCVWTTIVEQSATSLHWADIGKRLLGTAVEHHWYNIIKFMSYRFPFLLTEDGDFKMVIFQQAIKCCNAYVIELFFTNDVELNRDIDPYSYDQLIDNAYNKFEGLKRTPVLNNPRENITRSEQILKCLLEYPHNRYNQHGIVLVYDEISFGVMVSSNNSLNINRQITNNQTVLDIWIHRENESTSYGSQTPQYIRKIISDIVKYLIKHVAMRQTLNVSVSTNNLQAINSNNDYQQFLTECNNEIRQMIGTLVQKDTSIYVFDIITANRNTFDRYAEDRTIRRQILSDSFLRDFPIFGRDIVITVLKSIKKQERYMNEP